jgi:hypothetical protein
VQKAVLRRRMKYLRCTLFSPKKEEEGRRYNPDEKSDDYPPFDLSALSLVVYSMRTIQHIPDVLALLSVSLKYKARSVLA